MPKLRYLESTDGYIENKWCIQGVPLDDTASFRKGSSKGPNGVREASDGLEEYCPISDKSLFDLEYSDVGDLDFSGKSLESKHQLIEKNTLYAIEKGVKLLSIGGEHGVTGSIVKAYLSKYPNLKIIHFDAHADLRESYSDTPLSHASVLYRITEMTGFESIYQCGIRSVTREEWQWMRRNNTFYPATIESMDKIITEVKDNPVYVTLDLDILDPSVLPGTGTPEPGGIDFILLDNMLRRLSCLNIVAADVVELAPDLDLSGVSSITAAKLIRTMLMEW